MADDDHVAILKKGANAWNAWRRENYNLRCDLRGANLSGAILNGVFLFKANLTGANLSGAKLRKASLHDVEFSLANLSGTDLSEANLIEADLSKADLREAILYRADLSRAKLTEAKLSGANLSGANLSGANLSGANLSKPRLSEADLKMANLWREGRRKKGEADLTEAQFSRALSRYKATNLSRANLIEADLSKADLQGGDLQGANLGGANLSSANLRGADLTIVTLVKTNLTDADLTGCRIYGVSAWGLKLDGSKQQNLVITPGDEPEVTVDNIEVAQFIYLMLNNQTVRAVIDTITSKVVLILGRFTDQRKAVLDAIRKELRKRDYVPLLFDFEVPARRNITETITLLARMARFIIADLTDPSSIPQELQAIIPSVRVPVQPLLLEGSSLYSMFKDFDPQDFHWVLPVYRYKEPEQLLATLVEKVIAPAEGKVKVLEERRRMIEAELSK